MTIKVHIDRLIMDGMPVKGHEGAVVQRAMEEELARLITEGGLSTEFASGRAYPEVPSRNISVSGSDAKGIGREIARAVYGGIGP